MVLSHLSAMFIIPASVFFMRRIRWDPLPQLQWFQNFFQARNGPWIKTDGNLKAQDQGCMLGVVPVWLLPIPQFLSWLFIQCGVSHCTAARELWVPLSQNFDELVWVVENKDPHWLHAHLEQNSSESHLQNSTRHITLLWGRTDFLTMT